MQHHRWEQVDEAARIVRQRWPMGAPTVGIVLVRHDLFQIVARAKRTARAGKHNFPVTRLAFVARDELVERLEQRGHCGTSIFRRTSPEAPCFPISNAWSTSPLAW